MHIYIIRHGETDWNAEKRLQGRADIRLNEQGRDLAKKTGKGLRDISFDLAITSPLKRARETAELVLENQNIPIIEDERIIEISFGEFEGLISGRKGYEIPDPNFPDFFHAPHKYNPPSGGESITELAKRTADFMDELLNKEEYREKTILVATHGGAMRGLLNSVREYTMADFWGKGVPQNCCVTIIKGNAGNAEILKEDACFYN